MRCRCFPDLLTILTAWLAVTVGGQSLASEIDFLRDIEPILKRNCYRCHAGENEEAGLRLDAADQLLGKADSDESIVVPKHPERSWLVHRIADAEYGDLMPLDGEPLKRREIKLIAQWVEQGARLPKGWSAGTHWAYVSPILPEIPEVDEQTLSRPRNPIDQFIANRLQREGFRMSDDAPAATLARRVSLALTGLPATPGQLARFCDHPTEESYEAFVDRLLGSIEFGQHWARHWLDLARYADSNGFQADQIRDAWAYRDWVVDALNADMPFDQFVIEQLAGDLLPDANTSTRIATGFHRTPTCNVEAGVDPEANRVNQVFDRVNTTATVFLGTTFECAQCHDHKYDPFTQEDYYRFFAYFNNTPIEVEQTAGVTFDFVGPKMDLPMLSKQEQQLNSLNERLEKLKLQRKEVENKYDFDQWLGSTRKALKRGRAKWVTPRADFDSTADESFEVLEDSSVLISGTLPGSSIYRFKYVGSDTPFREQVLGVRIDAIRDPSLPGGGPGRGDAERTNFVLHELEMFVQNTDSREQILFGDANASFSQAKYGVDQAIDGNPKTGWAIAPQFKKAHWAEFLTTQPVTLAIDQTLVVVLDQHFGRGRVIGRPKISFLVGPPETVSLTDEIAKLLQSDDPPKGKTLKKLRTFYASTNPKIAELDRKIKALQASVKKVEPPTTLVMVELESMRKTHVMQRGDYLAKGDVVSSGTPASLHSLDPSFPSNRLGLAKWIVDPRNPLLARVTLNRFWMQIFGRGLVTTPEDFGTQAESPSHPQLLDWLALEFQSNGWSVKQMLKTIVMSSTFRQSSRITDELLKQDPDNVLLARGPRYRLPAETIRDNALAISGLLSIRSGGAPIMPYQPNGIWRAVGRNQPKWQAAIDDNRYRRGLYVVWKRSAPYPSFVTFDAPDRASCTVKRPRTNTPLQALVLLNDQAYAEAATALATRMLRLAPSSDLRAIARSGYKLATAMDPSDEAIDILIKLYQDERERLENNRQTAANRIGVLPKAFRDEKLDTVEIASWYAVASTLLNLDATITLN